MRDMAETGGLVVPLRFTTSPLVKLEQFAAYRAFNASAIDLSLPAGEADGFQAGQEVWDLGSLVFSRASLPGGGTARRWRHLKRDPLDHWCLVLPVSSATDAQGFPIAAGPLGLRSLARPFEGEAADEGVLTLFIPRDMFGAMAAVLDDMPDVMAGSGLGSVLADYMLILDRRLPGLRREELPSLVEATRALIGACLAPTADRIAAAADPIALTLREKARRFIKANLCAPDLGPERLCRELGLSRSRLYRLFEPLGGVMRYVQRQRLLMAHAALSDVEDRRHVVQIAESLGFTDASGFSRAFRNEFGHAPREAREAAWAGAPGVMPPASGLAGARRLPPPTGLDDLLRRLTA